MEEALLTDEQLAQKKAEARTSEIRQNVKSHCTKIRDGIQKNNSTSAHRAIWELFQNAGDLADSAEIKITLNKNSFSFAHKGKPFTYDTLCSLVKQVSSEEKENDDTVGQYGTGFLSTHKFGLKIYVNGSMCISQSPNVYVDIDNFEINRELFADIPKFIDSMTEQISAVDKLMDAPQHSIPREWTELRYELNDERHDIAKNAIDDAIKLMPYVLTFNDNIGSCSIEDSESGLTINFTKEALSTTIDDLHAIRIKKSSSDNDIPQNIDCFFLELHNGDSRIILPLVDENTVKKFGDVPRLFVHFPLIGSQYFNVNFIFHSHRFTPEEARDNIIVPKNNDAVRSIAQRNISILSEMTEYLWSFLENNIKTWANTKDMGSIAIRDTGYTESETEEFYKSLKSRWVEEFTKLPIIDIDGCRYSLACDNHPKVLGPDLLTFMSEEENKDFLPILYSYAKAACPTIPNINELLEWSDIVNGWNLPLDKYSLDIEVVAEYISHNMGDALHPMLELLVKAGYERFFEKHALLPNREYKLKVSGALRNAEAITDDLYKLVNALDPSIGDKFVHQEFADIISLTKYTRANLRDEMNSSINTEKNNVEWNNGSLISEGFESAMIDICSAYTVRNGDSKRNRIMPLICKFEGREYTELYIPAHPDDDKSLDIYRQIFINLVENQMRKIANRDAAWVKENLIELSSFVDNARGDDFKYIPQYSIYPDMNCNLHVASDLKKNAGIDPQLFDLYEKTFNVDLREKCVHADYELLHEIFAKDENQCSSQSVSKEIQNKLSAGQYKDVIVLDIIELIENSDVVGNTWRMWFNDIYKQRESIRYNLGTPEERSAINRMMKQRNPKLLERMADITEYDDANDIMNIIDAAINQSEHDAYIKKLGSYVERNLLKFLETAVKPYGIEIKDEQGGQDFILSKEGYEDYRIEVKSRWVDKESVIMSELQFKTAVENRESYALISAQMWTFDKQRALNDEPVSLEEIYQRLRVLTNIGYLEEDLLEPINRAFICDDKKIHVVGNYGVHVPQDFFKGKQGMPQSTLDPNPCDFNGLIEHIINHFCKI